MPKSTPLLERLKACLEKHPEWDDARIAAAIVGSGIENVRSVRAGGPLVTPVEEEKPVEAEQPAAPLPPNMTLISVDDIKRKYDMFGAIMGVIRSLPPGQVIAEADLKASVDHPDPFRFRKTIEAHEKELEPYRIMLKYRGSEAKYHYARPDVIADIRRTLETP